MTDNQEISQEISSKLSDIYLQFRDTYSEELKLTNGHLNELKPMNDRLREIEKHISYSHLEFSQFVGPMLWVTIVGFVGVIGSLWVLL